MVAAGDVSVEAELPPAFFVRFALSDFAFNSSEVFFISSDVFFISISTASLFAGDAAGAGAVMSFIFE